MLIYDWILWHEYFSKYSRLLIGSSSNQHSKAARKNQIHVINSLNKKIYVEFINSV